MNKKIRFIVFSTLLLTFILINVSFTFAQAIPWDYCKVSAYGTALNDEMPLPNRFEFRLADPPSGTNIPNSVEVLNYDTWENYTITPSVGDMILVNYDGCVTINLTITPASESQHYVIYYEGEVNRVRINYDDVPEFPPILIVPLFMTATLLALIYRRKKTT